MNEFAYDVLTNDSCQYNYIGDDYMKEKKKKLTYTFYDPNPPEKTLELLKKIIVESMISRRVK